MAPPRRRKWRVAGYILIAAAGTVALISPAPSIARAVGWLAYLWATWLLLGAGVCAVGGAVDRWLGEYTGLPLLIAALAAYAVVLTAGSWPARGFALLLAGFGSKLVARWQDVAAVRREALRTAARR